MPEPGESGGVVAAARIYSIVKSLFDTFHSFMSDAPYLAAEAMSRKRGALALLPSIPWFGIPGAIALGSGLMGGAGPIVVVNMAARAAAANPRRPTPAIPAAPPDFVSGSTRGDNNGGVPSGGVAGGGGAAPMKGGRWLSADGLLAWSIDGRRIWSIEGRI